MKKILAVATACALLVACGTVKTAVNDVVTPANVTTACSWIQTGDTVFKTASTLSPKIAAFAPQEAEADAAATTLCTQPYPTDLAGLLAKLLVIVAQVQSYSVTPAS